MKRTGIYIIKSKIKPERVYVGSAVDIAQRWRDHLSTLNNIRHRSPMLQNHVNKYGIEDLSFSILELVMFKEDLVRREQHYIDALNPFFNCLKIAGSPIGHKHSEETKRKISIGNTGKVFSEERKRKISKARKGQKVSEEAKKKMSESRKGKSGKWNIGRKASEETRRKISLRNMGNTNGRFLKGIKRSEETRKKMSIARIELYKNKFKKAC
jgi:group I intron endonuclease